MKQKYLYVQCQCIGITIIYCLLVKLLYIYWLNATDDKMHTHNGQNEPKATTTTIKTSLAKSRGASIPWTFVTNTDSIATTILKSTQSTDCRFVIRLDANVCESIHCRCWRAKQTQNQTVSLLSRRLLLISNLFFFSFFRFCVWFCYFFNIQFVRFNSAVPVWLLCTMPTASLQYNANSDLTRCKIKH